MTDVLKVKWFKNSPDAGPHCTCSVCGKPILDFALRLFRGNREARFHIPCWNFAFPNDQITGASELTNDEG